MGGQGGGDDVGKAAGTKGDKLPNPFPKGSKRAATLEAYDRKLALLEETSAWQQDELKRIRERDEQMRQNLPNPLVSLWDWAAGELEEGTASAAAELEETRDFRDEFIAELAADHDMEGDVEGDLDREEEEEVEQMKQVEEFLESPAWVSWAVPLNCLISSWILAWVGSAWFGLAPAAHLVEPADWQAAAGTLAAWTVPYLAGTLLAAAVHPSSMTQPIRFSPVGSAACTSLPVTGKAGMALAVGYSQVLIWQGLWLAVGLRVLGVATDGAPFLDPGLLDDQVQAGLGALVAPSRTPLLLALPGASLFVGVLEAGWWLACEAARRSARVESSDGEGYPVQYFLEMPDVMINGEMLLPTAGRIVLSSAYLAAESLIAGSLWLPVLTSSAGILTAMLLQKSKEDPYRMQ